MIIILLIIIIIIRIITNIVVIIIIIVIIITLIILYYNHHYSHHYSYHYKHHYNHYTHYNHHHYSQTRQQTLTLGQVENLYRQTKLRVLSMNKECYCIHPSNLLELASKLSQLRTFSVSTKQLPRNGDALKKLKEQVEEFLPFASVSFK